MKTAAVKIAALLFIFGAIIAPGCSRLDRDRNVLRVNIQTEPPTLDWSIATDSTSIQVINNIMQGLTRYDDELTPQPDLAESWDISDDGLTYTFHLRKGVKWTDGKPLTAQHFVDGWHRLLDPATAAEYSYFLYDITGAQDYNEGKNTDFSRVGVSAPDDHTLVVRLNKPIVYLPGIVSFMCTFPIRRDVIDKWGDKWTEPEHIQTLGYYKVVGWKHEYRLDLEANENHHIKKPEIDRVEMFMVNKENTELDLYDTGAMDIVRVPNYAVPYYTNKAGFEQGPAFWMLYYGFNIRKAPFDNIDVRKAFAHAIDCDEIVDVVKGGAQAWRTWIPPRMTANNPDGGMKFDVAEAKELLKRAGYENGNELPEIILGYNTNLVNEMVATNVQEQLSRNLGVKIRLDNMEWKVYLSMLKENPPQFFRLSWLADYADPDNYMALFKSVSGNNHTNWGNPEYDRLVEEAAVERDPVKRKEIYDRAQKILLVDDCVIVPLFDSQINRMVSPRVEGYKVNAMDLIFLERLKLKPQ